jgi:UDP-3-O-[3-hydroxymyristoyl] glucosamine N-acyltransferase
MKLNIVNAIHPFSIISKSVKIEKAVMVAAGVIINPLCINKRWGHL